MRQFDEVADAELTLVSADASFRRYFRVRKGDISRIIMDALPDKEDCGPFLRVAAWLQAMNLQAPRVLATNLEQGFLLLTDLGPTQYLQALTANPKRCDVLYADAIDSLLTLQNQGQRFQANLPVYDAALLHGELALFSDWLCKTHLGIEFSADEARNWHACCDFLATNALDQPVVFVHRDYHSRNLMLLDERNPGILDFQDAVAGPYTYDLVSLLKDCYIAWPPERVLAWAMSFFRKRPAAVAAKIDADTFLRHFELMGVQRQLKAAGIFARLHRRDHKPAYMLDIPRTLNYVLEIAPRYDELTFLAQLISERILPGLEGPET